MWISIRTNTSQRRPNKNKFNYWAKFFYKLSFSFATFVLVPESSTRITLIIARNENQTMWKIFDVNVFSKVNVFNQSNILLRVQSNSKTNLNKSVHYSWNCKDPCLLTQTNGSDPGYIRKLWNADIRPSAKFSCQHHEEQIFLETINLRNKWQ